MSALAPHPHHPLRGALLMVGAVSVFALMDTISKYLARSYPVPGIVWARYAFQMLVMLLFLAPRMKLDLVRSRRPGLQIARGAVLAFSSLILVTALKFMPIAETSAIMFVTPLLVVALSASALGERPGTGIWAAVIAGFVGVLVIVRPGAGMFSWAALLALLAAVCFAFYQILTRKLTGVDRTMTTLFYPAMVGTAALSVTLPFVWTAPQSLWHAALFATIGVLGGISHFILIRAYESAPASVLAPLQYSQLASVLFLGWLVFDDFPDSWSLLGMTIIVASGVFVATRRRLSGI